MKFNKWTIALASAGVVSLGSAVQADEHPVTSALGAVTIGGYVDTSAIWQIGRQAGVGVVNNMPGRSYDGGDKIDGFNLNVVKLSLEKPLDESSWSAGYKVDLLFGPDANAYGTQSTLSTATSDFGIKQAYVALRAPVGNGLDLKMGVFDTIIGYEVFEAGNNPNYSRSYGYFMEPTTHTGLLASYQLTDWMSVAAGIADTWDPRVNGRAQYFPVPGLPPSGRAESEKTYMGSIALTAPESMGFLEGATLYGGVVEGQPSGGTSSDFVNWYAGATMPTPVEGLSLGLSYDYFGQSAQGAVAGQYANAISGYLVWKATEKMTVASRSEYATFSGNYFGPVGGTGLREVFAETLTLDYKLWDPVVTRLELRWDHDMDGGTPFGDLDTNALSLALNVIYKF